LDTFGSFFFSSFFFSSFLGAAAFSFLGGDLRETDGAQCQLCELTASCCSRCGPSGPKLARGSPGAKKGSREPGGPGCGTGAAEL